MKNIVIWLASISVISFVIGVSFMAPGRVNLKLETKSVDESKTESLSDVNRLEIGTISANVKVNPTDAAEVTAHYTGTMRSNNPSSVPELTVNKSAGTLSVKTGTTGAQFFHIVDYQNFTLEVNVPRAYTKEMVIETISGEVETGDLASEQVSINTKSGNITTGSISGALTLETISGDSLIRGLSRGLAFTSVSGELDARFSALTDTVSAKTTSGDVYLRLPSDSSFKLDYETVSGELTNDFAMTSQSSDRRHTSGTIADGAHRINTETVSGDVRIEKQ